MDFGAFGIRIERESGNRLSYRREAAVALGGVLVNAFLFAAFSSGYFFLRSKTLFIGAAVNFLIASLNLMPVGILDCGRFLRYILLTRFDEEKTEAVLSLVSDFTVLLFALFCVLFTVFVGLNASLICVCIYLMLINLKRRQTND